VKLRSIPPRTCVTLARTRSRLALRGFGVQETASPRTRSCFLNSTARGSWGFRSNLLNSKTAREGKLISVARDWSKRNIKPSDMPLLGKRGRMRSQISRKPFDEKLLKLQNDLNELAQFELEGFDISKLKNELEEQIARLFQLLGEEGGSRRSEVGRRKWEGGRKEFKRGEK